MPYKSRKIKSFDEKQLMTHEWICDDPRAALLIVHGMSEHGKRYGDFAAFLNQQNIIVRAYDQRGHGATAKSEDALGYTEDGNFWEKVIKDVGVQLGEIRSEHSNIPIYLMGHSMGSFITRRFVQKSGANLTGVILSGTGGNPGPLLSVGSLIAKIIGLIKGRNHKSNTLSKMSFGKFNDSFKPARTEFDWLSRDPKQVDKYINDPHCGQMSSVGLWQDLMQGLKLINQTAAFEQTNKELPVLLFAGDQDPVGAAGKGVQEVHDRYQAAGIKDLTIKLYKDARHETLNETNKAEVYQDVLNWITQRI